MSRAVRFDDYGPTSVLEVVEVDDPKPTGAQVRVAVVSAGINPGEIGIRSGAMAEMFPATFPSGQGSDFAGLVAAVGADVTAVSVGDEVIGWSDERSAQAEFVTVPESQLLPKPPKLDWAVAGSLYVAGTTAVAMIRAAGVERGDTVVIAGAAGGVGVIAAQLAVLRGARVIGTASESHHAELTALGVEPVTYGDGLADRIRALAPYGVTAFLDCFGSGNVALALDELHVPADRIDTIADFAAVGQRGVKGEGMAAVDSREAMTELVELLADNRLTVPIAAHYPLERVRDAYDELAKRHSHGKIVLDVRSL